MLLRATTPRLAKAPCDPAMAFVPPLRRTGRRIAPGSVAAALSLPVVRRTGLRFATNARDNPARYRSAANSEFFDQPFVALLVGAPEIIKQLTTLRHELEQPAARVVVLDVRLEMLGEVVDPFGQDRDLHLGRSGVAGLRGIGLDDFCLTLSSNRHRLVTFLRPAASHHPGQVEYARAGVLAA